jgi:serine/threonine protein kinase
MFPPVAIRWSCLAAYETAEPLNGLSFRSAVLSREESVVPLLAASRFLADKPGIGMTSIRLFCPNCTTTAFPDAAVAKAAGRTMVGAWRKTPVTKPMYLQTAWWAACQFAGRRTGEIRKPRGNYGCTPIRENVMGLTPDQWEKVKELFEAALEKSETEQASFLANASPDLAIRSEVERLLANHTVGSGSLSIPAAPPATLPRQFLSPGNFLAQRFRVIRFLASGGMGEVYEAEDAELGERVALKIIRPDLLDDGRSLERFKREVHLARSVTHPNICRIFDLFRHQISPGSGNTTGSSFVFVSMELLQGETLAAYLKRTPRMTTTDALPVAAQVASGLAAAHEAGVLHRDLKPGNIILVPGAKRVRAVITDFGLALRSTSDSSRSGALTDTGKSLGTPAYMSPEQVEGRELTAASDVYSLGLVLYQLITGTRAFDDGSPLSMAVRRLREDPTPPHALVDDLDPRWEAVILRCLDRDPTRRFQNADEVSRALKGELDFVSAPVAIVSESNAGKATSQRLAAPRISEDAIRTKTWELSRDHLSSILGVDEYDENGKRIRPGTAGVRRASFEEELYVSPPETEILRTFLELNQPPGSMLTECSGLVVLGSAGAGKSNLLASTFLGERSAGGVNIFLTGRLIDTADMAKFIGTQAARFISSDWDLAALLEFVSQCGRRLTIFLDAANEYCGPQGAFGLLDSVRSLINRSGIAATLRVVVSCRAETWRLYEDEKGIKLFDSGRLFRDEPLALHGFDEPTQANLLFQKYVAFYSLRPSRYTELSPTVKDLIRSPLMMSMVAETYSNPKDEGTAAKLIPPDLDYYNIFRRLTRRKKQDARRLLHRNDPRREYFDEAMDGALLLFARLLLAQLAGSAPAAIESASRKQVSVGDSIMSSTLSRSQDFVEYWAPPRGRDEAVPTFQAIVQVGLIDAISLNQYGSHETLQRRTVYKFFHDQYTQYWLSQIYQSETLGKLDAGLSPESGPDLRDLAENICRLIQQSVQVPVLAGAIDHWLYRNMVIAGAGDEETQGTVEIGLLMPLLNQLALSPSPVVEQYVSSFLTNLTLRGILTPDQLFQSVFREGNEKLRTRLAGYFMECWPGVSPDLLSTFLAHCEADRDADVLKRLGEVFAYHFDHSPAAVVEYLDGALKPVDSFARALAFALEQSPLRVGRREEYASQITFLLTFGTLSALANFHSEVHMSQMRAFVRRKYPWLLDMILNRPNRMKVQEEAFRLGLYRTLEKAGVTQWDQVIGEQGNDAFFVEENGVVQRDEIFNYFKYMVATHNGDLDVLDLRPGSDFRRSVMAMLTFKPRSGVGYVAAVTLAMRLVRDRGRLEEIVTELVDTGRTPGVHSAALLLVDISYMDPALSGRTVELFVQRILPKSIQGEYPFDRAVLDCIGIATIDLAGNWKICEPAIRRVFEQLSLEADEAVISRLGDELAKVSYFDDILAGRNVIELLLRENYLNHPLWRGCVMKILAGMQMRNPALLRSTLEQHGEDDRTLKEVRLFASDQLKDGCDKFFYAVSWNRLICKAILDNTTLRYFLFKILIGGIAQSNSVTEYTHEFRRFVVEIVRAYWGEEQDPHRYDRFTVEEAFAETLSKRRVGGGKLWVPRAPRGGQKGAPAN